VDSEGHATWKANFLPGFASVTVHRVLHRYSGPILLWPRNRLPRRSQVAPWVSGLRSPIVVTSDSRAYTASGGAATTRLALTCSAGSPISETSRRASVAEDAGFWPV